jgi:hypothetical protein
MNYTTSNSAVNPNISGVSAVVFDPLIALPYPAISDTLLAAENAAFVDVMISTTRKVK